MNSPTRTSGKEALGYTSLAAVTEAIVDAATDTDNVADADGCSGHRTANNTSSSPSLLLGVSSIDCDGRSLNFHRHAAAYGGSALRHLLHVLSCVIALSIAGGFTASCGDTPKPAETKSEPAPAPAEPAKPAVPDDIQTGKQQFMAANVVPKTTKNNNIPGTIITRAVIAQNDEGQWKEIFRCDEHLKNAKGFLGGTPVSDDSGWRIAYEQDPAKGLSLYLTPLK